MAENILILGATSGIGRALCHVMAKRGCRLGLTGRDQEELNRIARDLEIRYGADVFVELFDATDFVGHRGFFDRCLEQFDGDLTGAVLCYGYLSDQRKSQDDFSEVRHTVEVNFLSPQSILNLVAAHLEQRGSGYIAGISSVAGDRGRQKNYTYGATKGGMSVYLQGLRNRLYHCGVHVLTIKPGFVDTPMIHGRVNPKSPLVASPERVARDIDRAIRRRKNVLYTPRIWWWILFAVCSLPEWLFKRLKL